MIALFNELSILTQPDKPSARKMMESFITTYSHSLQNGITEVRLPESIESIYSWTLSPEYLVSQWAQDDEIDRPLKQRFKSIVLKSPLFNDDEIDEISEYNNSDFTHKTGNEGKKCLGLGASYVFDSLSMSLDSADIWRQTSLAINHFFVNDNLEEFNQSRDIRHYYSIPSFKLHKDWIDEKIKEAAKSSSDIWAKREEFFPNLIFCGETEKQLLKNTLSGKIVGQVYDKLKTFNSTSDVWKKGAGGFDYTWATTNYPLAISPESESTMNKYGKSRRFRLPDGSFEIFELHIKFQNEIRIHFFPKAETREIFIGYIGKHLPISSE